MEIEDIIEDIHRREGFIVNSEFCPGCKREEPGVGMVYIPFEVNLRGKNYKTLVTFLCEACLKEPNTLAILKNLIYFAHEMNMDIL